MEKNYLNLTEIWKLWCREDFRSAELHFFEYGYWSAQKNNNFSVYCRNQLVLPNLTFFYIFKDGTQIVEKDNIVRFYDADNKLLVDETNKYNQYYADCTLIYANGYGALIVRDKDNRSICTTYKHPEKLFALDNYSEINEITDTPDGDIVIQLENEIEYVLYPYVSLHHFSGTLVACNDNNFVINNNGVLTRHQIDLSQSEKIVFSENTDEFDFSHNVLYNSFCHIVGENEVRVIWKNYVHVRYKKMNFLFDLDKSAEENLLCLREITQAKNLTEYQFYYFMLLMQLLQIDIPFSKMLRSIF